MIRLLSSLLLLLVSTSCVSQLESTAAEGADLGRDLTYYVVSQPEDDKQLNEELCSQLKDLERNASTGVWEKIPQGTDVVVQYQAQWVWDITMYLHSMSVTFIEVQTELELAKGTSTATSMIRENPKWHINTLLTDILAKTNPGDQPGERKTSEH